MREIQTTDGRTLFVVAVIPQPTGGRCYACAATLREARIARSRVRDEGVAIIDQLHGLIGVDALAQDAAE